MPLTAADVGHVALHASGVSHLNAVSLLEAAHLSHQVQHVQHTVVGQNKAFVGVARTHLLQAYNYRSAGLHAEAKAEVDKAIGSAVHALEHELLPLEDRIAAVSLYSLAQLLHAYMQCDATTRDRFLAAAASNIKDALSKFHRHADVRVLFWKAANDTAQSKQLRSEVGQLHLLLRVRVRLWPDLTSIQSGAFGCPWVCVDTKPAESSAWWKAVRGLIPWGGDLSPTKTVDPLSETRLPLFALSTWHFGGAVLVASHIMRQPTVSSTQLLAKAQKRFEWARTELHECEIRAERFRAWQLLYGMSVGDLRQD